MHLCFVNMPIEYYSPVSGGAISTVIMNVSRELLARGHKVTVLTITNDDAVYDVGNVVPIEARRREDMHFIQRRISSIRQKIAHWDWPYFEYYLRSVSETLPRLSPVPDAVIVCNDLVSPASIKRILPHTKVFVWLHNEWRTRFNMAETIRNTDLFFTCSEYVRQWTAKTHGLSLDKIVVCHNGVDCDFFTPPADMETPRNPVRVLALGRIDPNKGPDIAADAVAALRAQELPVSLTVAGGLWFYGHGNEMSDPFFCKLKTKMDAANAEYLGHVPRAGIPDLVRRHDIACVLSRSNEPFGLVALEAMAGGCAVIASNRGGLPEACGDAGILVDPDDFAAVTEAMRTLVTDPGVLLRTKQKSIIHAAGSPWSKCAHLFERAAAGTTAMEMAA
jgi:glycosyltransferase involved in cell wall biosynthesis